MAKKASLSPQQQIEIATRQVMIGLSGEEENLSPEFKAELLRDGMSRLGQIPLEHCAACGTPVFTHEAVSIDGKPYRMRITTGRLESGFFNKLTSHLKKANEQMDAYDRRTDVRRIVYLVVNFDDILGDCKAQHFKQINRYLEENPVRGIEVVFQNQKTPLETGGDSYFVSWFPAFCLGSAHEWA
jgi:hypothetical protein